MTRPRGSICWQSIREVLYRHPRSWVSAQDLALEVAHKVPPEQALRQYAARAAHRTRDSEVLPEASLSEDEVSRALVRYVYLQLAMMRWKGIVECDGLDVNGKATLPWRMRRVRLTPKGRDLARQDRDTADIAIG